MIKLILVDDDEDILALVKLSLTMYDFQVETTPNWEQVDDHVRSFSPELILMDISLKGADGRDLCKKIKENETTKHIPILLFSANAELGKTFRDYKAAGFIEKPYTLPHLLSTLKEHLAN